MMAGVMIGVMTMTIERAFADFLKMLKCKTCSTVCKYGKRGAGCIFCVLPIRITCS